MKIPAADVKIGGLFFFNGTPYRRVDMHLPTMSLTSKYPDLTVGLDLNTYQLTGITSNKTVTTLEDIDDNNENTGTLFGWVCPKCGAVMSPFTDCCPNCTQRSFTFTYNTTGPTL